MMLSPRPADSGVGLWRLMRLYRESALLLLLTSVAVCVGCRRPAARVALSGEQSPLTFVLEGDGDLHVKFVRVDGPYTTPSLEDPGAGILWHIMRADYTYPRLSEVPPVSYGRVPAGWRQEIPEAGAPRRLEEGSIYIISVIVDMERAVTRCVRIQGGRAVEYREGRCDKSEDE